MLTSGYGNNMADKSMYTLLKSHIRLDGYGRVEWVYLLRHRQECFEEDWPVFFANASYNRLYMINTRCHYRLAEMDH